MYINDKILKGGEITSIGTFELDKKDFYLFIAPKNAEGASVLTLSSILAYNGNNTIEFPFMVGTWNPVVLHSVTIGEGNLSNYRFFWGQEG